MKQDSQQAEEKSIKDKVLSAIESGEVKMRPKWQFIARTSLLLAGFILSVLTLLYLSSLIIFILRYSGAWFAPGFGLRGIGIFLSALPWYLVLLALLFIVLLEVLFRRYSFGYRKPLLYSALAVMVLAAFGGFFIAGTSFHSGLFVEAEEGRLPFAGRLYRQHGLANNKNIITGVVEKVTNDGFLIQAGLEEAVEVSVSPETRRPLGGDFKVGDRVVVLGELKDGSVKAFGVRKVPDNFPKHFRKGRMLHKNLTPVQ